MRQTVPQLSAVNVTEEFSAGNDLGTEEAFSRSNKTPYAYEAVFHTNISFKGSTCAPKLKDSGAR
uniref:Uncharacterized protein n=1 Tax=Anguilla anguilla TaxID=7936 RepID=A0A0E9WX82_ANGAN